MCSHFSRISAGDWSSVLVASMWREVYRSVSPVRVTYTAPLLVRPASPPPTQILPLKVAAPAPVAAPEAPRVELPGPPQLPSPRSVRSKSPTPRRDGGIEVIRDIYKTKVMYIYI